MESKARCFVVIFVWVFLMVLFTAEEAKGRALMSTPSSFAVGATATATATDDDDDDHGQLISDGVERRKQHDQCVQFYGFLPCSYTPIGHLFLVVVYEYLLFHGESYIAHGGQRIFKLQGPGFFGASAFRVLGFLPEATILLASGLLEEKELAQEYVLTGVGLLTGTTTLLLTLLWGTCIIIASKDFPSSNPTNFLAGRGITTDSETKYMARIMVLSLIPFVLIQIPETMNLSVSGERIVILITLIFSVLFLLAYFLYQFLEPWIQKRTLELVKHEYFVVDVLRHVQRHVSNKLLTQDGTPNTPVIKRMFEQLDEDRSNSISLSELVKLFPNINYEDLSLHRKAVEVMMQEFDINSDHLITEEEFVKGFSKWLIEAKQAIDKEHHTTEKLKHLYEVSQLWIDKRRKDYKMEKHLISEILLCLHDSELEKLLREDRTPDVEAIKRLFSSCDVNNDGCLTTEEVKEMIKKLSYHDMPRDEDELHKMFMEKLDRNGDQVITEDELVHGISKLLSHGKSLEAEDDRQQRKWEEMDLLVEDSKVNRSLWAWGKAIAVLAVGIGMLGVLAEPLIQTVERLSRSANLPSFMVAFILVPAATNARAVIAAIKTVSKKTERTTSLTFSEIYGEVLMNNTLGFSVLLSLVYFRGFTWHFTAEILAVLIVCAIVGISASFTNKFPIWVSFLAYLLYPSSLLLVYLLDDVFNLT